MISEVVKISFNKGSSAAQYKGRDVKTIFPLTGSYDCALMQVTRDSQIFYLAIPIVLEFKDVQINNLVLKG